MSDAENASGGTVAPKVATEPSAPAKVEAPKDSNEPDQSWLKERLDRSRLSGRKELLEELGITDPAAAKEAIEAARKAAEDQKTLAEKLAEKSTAAEQFAARSKALEATLKSHADAMLAGLSDDQKASIQAIAGEDAQKIVDTVTALKWGPSALRAESALPAKAPVSDTAPSKKAPSEENTSPPDYKSQYEALRASNPYAAAVYMNRYASRIYPSE